MSGLGGRSLFPEPSRSPDEEGLQIAFSLLVLALLGGMLLLSRAWL